MEPKKAVLKFMIVVTTLDLIENKGIHAHEEPRDVSPAVESFSRAATVGSASFRMGLNDSTFFIGKI